MRRLELPPVATVAVAAGALVLAVASRGDLLVLGLLLALLAPTPATVVAVAGALTAVAWRWGDASLEALAGAQAVLGPAGGVGPGPAAAGSWLAAAALVLAVAPTRRQGGSLTIGVAAAAVGAAAAAVLAGPAPGGELPVRVIVGFGLAAGALGLARLRELRPVLHRALAWTGAGCGVGALLAVAPDAPAWPPRTTVDAAVEGIVLAGAAMALAVAGHAVVGRARWRTTGVPPIVARPRTDLSAGDHHPR